MSIELRREAADPADAAIAAMLDGFDEQTGFDVRAGRRTAWAFTTPADGLVALGVLGRGELDLTVRQELRAHGFGDEAASQLLALASAAGAVTLTAWSHEDHPAARAIAARLGFRASRVLLRMRRAFEGVPPHPHVPDGLVLDAFRPGTDDEAWIALNARIFAAHPEQGGVTLADLHERMAEPWFDPSDFLVLRDGAGGLIGYDWLKNEPDGELGEIYVLGVAPEHAGHGLGLLLSSAGLERLHHIGRTGAELYADADNTPAVSLYRSLGFQTVERHVQYSGQYSGQYSRTAR